jgi:hypothetical protein
MFTETTKMFTRTTLFTRTKLPNGGEVREYPNGDKFYSLNKLYHREDGPTIELANGDKYWYLNDKLHREDGPASESGSDKAWYINGERLPCTTQEQFERLMRLKAFW